MHRLGLRVSYKQASSSLVSSCLNSLPSFVVVSDSRELFLLLPAETPEATVVRNAKRSSVYHDSGNVRQRGQGRMDRPETATEGKAASKEEENHR